jgi:two-component system KDP operon response regulator KdpE
VGLPLNQVGPRILVIDDEPQIHRFLRPALRAAGYEVIQALTAADGLLIVKRQMPCAVLLDLELPDMDGHDVLARLRMASDLPILIISARDREADKVGALDGGADDYLEKPFSISELLARLRVALRHRQGTELTQVLEFPGLTVDLQRRMAIAAGVPVSMTPREWGLLLKLAQNAGRVITHRQLLVSIWGPTHAGDLQYLRVYVAALRQKLGAAGALIATEVGIGYRMAERLQTRERAHRAKPAD